MEIKGKTALVTGGAQRVGKGITLGLARAGANIVVNYHSSAEEAAQTVREAEALGVSGLAVQADVSDWEQVQRMFEEVNNKTPGVDILVNNSSLFLTTPVPSMDMGNWHKVTSVLLDGSFYCTNMAAFHMLEKKEGAVINIVDLSVWEAWPRFSAHAVGKSGLMALTRQFALDLAPYVRVNAVCPGPVLPPDHYSPEKIKRSADKTLLHRWGSPEDISKAVNFLVDADYITGEVIIVDGGQRFGHRQTEEG
ncbi:MAG: SDR family oxidoreductase [Anaerolineaceae bacterium]|nr:SDR family oxidoreductase [Anaerolineaceae bacterium]